MAYLDDALEARGKTPQSEPIPGSSQVENNAGGYSWAVDDHTRVRRFLILGSEGGTFYQGEAALTKEHIGVGLRLVETDGEWLVNELVAVSLSGAAQKVQPTLFLLAAACSAGDVATRQAAFRAIPVICRTGTHLFTFCRYVESFRGWGRGLKRAVGAWYQQDPGKLAYQAVKYRQREGWSHGDVLRLTHPQTRDERLQAVWRFMLGREISEPTKQERTILGFIECQHSPNPVITAQLVRQFNLPREAVNPEHLTDQHVWAALLEVGMPLNALVRNLGNLSKAGLLEQMSSYTGLVCSRLTDPVDIAKSRLHPLSILTALLTYKSGHGQRGKGEWPVNQRVVQALDKAFYLAFGNVKPSGKATYLAIDVSGSMTWTTIGGIDGLTPRLGAACMALVTAAVEPNHGFYSFSGSMHALPIASGMTLDQVEHILARAPAGGTDCALPMLHAHAAAIEVDTFAIYTDSETWAGRVHPKQALDSYRKWRPEARCAVVGMVSSGFSIADPDDRGMMDFVGFDTGTPELLRAFSSGEI